MFNSRSIIYAKNEINESNDEEGNSNTRKKNSVSTNRVGNPNISLTKNHPSQIIESRRKYAAREYLDKVSESNSTVTPLAVAALGLSQTSDGNWNTNGTADERLYGQNLTKYNDTKLVPKTTKNNAIASKMRERFKRLSNKGYSDRDAVTFGTLIRDPYFKVDLSEDADDSARTPIGLDKDSGKITNALTSLTSHHFAAQRDFLDTIDGIEKSAFPKDDEGEPKITNVTGAINRGLRGFSKRFNKSLFVGPSGDKISFFKDFTTMGKNIQNMFQPYDKLRVQPPTQSELDKAKEYIRVQRPEFFNEKGDYANSEIGKMVNDAVSRFIIDKNNKTQINTHQNEYNGLVRALKNVAVCPCPHCQISNFENPLATVLDASLHREVKASQDQILKNVFKKHFGFYNPHSLMVNDPETIYTREDGTKGGGHPHSLSTNIVRQILHKRLKLRS